jgi:outer membrane lipoprotein LolB
VKKLAACAAAVFVAAFAAGCAQLERVSTEKPEYELSARLAARYRDEAFSGNLAWRHGRSSDELLITSPLGAGVARIVRDGDSVVLTTSEPRDYRAADAETLTEQVLGFRLPLAGLADWVRGRPSGQLPVARKENNAEGKLQTLEQGGWKIEYLEYRADLPSRLRLSYPGIELRLAISEWK